MHAVNQRALSNGEMVWRVCATNDKTNSEIKNIFFFFARAGVKLTRTVEASAESWATGEEKGARQAAEKKKGRAK